MNVRNLVGTLLGCMLLATPAVPDDSHARILTVGQADPADGAIVALNASDESGIEIGATMAGALANSVRSLDGNEYVQLSAAGCGASGKIGQPELPFKGFFVEIPRGTDVSVELLDIQTSTLGTGYRVYPAQPPMPDDGDSAPPFELDRAAYETDAFFPADPVVIDEPGYIRGRRVVFVQVFPLQYNPVTTELRALSSLRFRLAFDEAADESAAARKSRLASPQWEAQARTLILNYEPVRFDAGIDGGTSRDGAAADYLIIVDDDLSASIQPLADWKRRKGFRTRVAPISEVGSTAANVRAYIQDAYDTWNPAPSYVLLVGDAGDVPSDSYDGYYSCTSDHAYACVDGSDYYPDLTIGRLPVHTEAECVNVVAKILNQELTPDPGAWYDDFLAASYLQDNGDDGAQGDNDGVADRWFMETAMTAYNFMVNVKGWDGHTALCTTYWPLTHAADDYHFRDSSYPHREQINSIHWGVSPYPDPIPTWLTGVWTSDSQSTTDIRTAIDAGVGMVIHRDHGGETGWGDPPYHNSDVSALANGNKTPVVFSMNCKTGAFQYSSGDCFCEAFLKKYPGGAVGIVGATRTSFSGYNDLITHGILTCFWPEYDTTYSVPLYQSSMRPAEALNYGKYYMLFYEGAGNATAGEFYMFHWFGDPEMPLRTAAPLELAVEHPDAVNYGVPSNMTVRVTRGGAALADALVCVSHATEDADHWTATTDSTGLATLVDVAPTQFDGYRIVVSERDSLPYEGEIAVTHNLSIVPSALPELVDPGLPTEMTVRISEGNEQYVTGTGRMHYRFDGGEFLAVPLEPLGNDLYAAALPAARCDDVPEFYFSAEGTVSGVVTNPSDAPASVHAATVGTFTAFLTDDFETHQGWTVENDAALAAGAWQRGTPVGGGDRGDPPTDYDGSGQCYLTGNADGDSDVDGGTTWLISPTIDLTGGDADVGFALWYTNYFGADPNNDVFKIYVSNDDGATWTLVETVGPATYEGWTLHEFTVGDFVTPTALVRIRFEASDLGSGSVVEAGIDGVTVAGVVCEDPDCPGDLDGDYDVDLIDLAQLLAHYGNAGASYEDGDLDRDGDVDLTDLASLLALYGSDCD